MAKPEKRKQARRMRKEGASLGDIARDLHISKSSASVWTRDIDLTPEQRAAIKMRAQQSREEVARERFSSRRQQCGRSEDCKDYAEIEAALFDRMTPGEKGVIGVNKVVFEFSRMGVMCSRPISDHLHYDLIIDVGGRLARVQVKTSTKHIGGAVEFRMECSKNGEQRRGSSYDVNDCDIIACYDALRDEVYLLGVNDFVGKKSFSVRYKQPLVCCEEGYHNWHRDFSLTAERLSEVLGQLDEPG